VWCQPEPAIQLLQLVLQILLQRVLGKASCLAAAEKGLLSSFGELLLLQVVVLLLLCCRGWRLE
jgi:hypothetical protein